MRDTDKDWKRIAETAPYWGVLSADQYRGHQLSDANHGEFFQSGERFISDLLGLINAHLAGSLVAGRAMDFGCGVGRLAIPLCRSFKEVVGVDIADRMLALAGHHATAAGLTNLSLMSSDEALGLPDSQFNFINTYIVMQHIPPERGYHILTRLINLTKTGGICSFQLTYARERSFMVHEAPRARFYRRDGRHLVDIASAESSPPVGTINMYDYDLNEIFAIVSQFAGQPVLSLPTNDDGHLGVHLVFVRAR